MNNNYTVLHCHTELSLLDSCTNYKLYVDKCVELGQTAIAFTEHGNVYNWVEKKMYCDSHGIKYIHGIEIYITTTTNEENKIRDNYHTILLAKNHEGVKEINSLVDISSTEDHFYYKPRITLEEFLAISDNVIKISACLASPLRKIPNLIQDYISKLEDLKHKYDEDIITTDGKNIDNITTEYMLQTNKTIEKIERLNTLYPLICKHYDYYEIQSHVNSADQKEYNQYLLHLSKEYNKPLVVGTDTHSLNKYKAECRSIFQKANKNLYAEEEEDEFDLTYKTFDNLISDFRLQNVVPENIVCEALENTNIIAAAVEYFELDTSFKYPILYGDKDEEEFKKRVSMMYRQKVRNKVIVHSKKYLDKIREEYKVFKKIGMIGFMLFMSELVVWCWENNIPVGFCRGCFTEDTFVTTKTGLQPIKEVRTGDYILTDNGEWHRVNEVYEYEINEPLIKIEYLGCEDNNFTPVSTTDHKFLVYKNAERSYVPVSEIKEGDYLCCPNITFEFSEKSLPIDLNKYNQYYEYDEKYVYEIEKISKYPYSPMELERKYGIHHWVLQKIINGWTPKRNDSKAAINKVLQKTPYKTMAEYAAYAKENSIVTTRLSRYIEMDELTNRFIGILYLFGSTEKRRFVHIKIPEWIQPDTKEYISDVVRKFMARLNIPLKEADIVKNLQRRRAYSRRLSIDDRIINKWIETEFFYSEINSKTVFNSKLLNQPKENLEFLFESLYCAPILSKSLSIINACKILGNVLYKKIYSVEKNYVKRFDNSQYIAYSLKEIITGENDIDEHYHYLPVKNVIKLEPRKTKVYDLNVDENHSYVLNNIAVHNSVGGSEIAYITDITDVDPMIWDTIFSRFANEDRFEIGDIDIDVCPDQRQIVYDYIIERFGIEKTAYVLAMGTISEKGTIDEIGRALKLPLKEVAIIKKEYDTDPNKARRNYPDLFYYFDGLLNTVKSQSVHPAGIVVSPITLPDNYGTFWKDGRKILCINMEEIHEVSLVKYDILGLKSLSVVRDSYKNLNLPYPKAHEINWKDNNVYKDMITSPVGLFQFESDFAFQLLKKIQPQNMADIKLVVASIRPSGASYRNELLERKRNKNPSKLIDDLLEDTYGWLVFQEDVIKFLQVICGLSGGEADNTRRAISRKDEERLKKALPQILEGYCEKSDKERSVAEQEAQQFLEILEDASEYMFGKNHATGYSMITYLCALLRCYNPLEFIAAYLDNADNTDDISTGTELAAVKGIKINPIKFRYSASGYTIDKETNSIYKGLTSVKFFSKTIAQQLYELRDNEYETFVDFLVDNPCDSRQTEILIKLNFFSEFGKTRKLMATYHWFKSFYKKSHFQKTKYDFSLDFVSEYLDETPLLYKIKDDLGLIKKISSVFPDEDLSIQTIINTQGEYIGYVDYINPELEGQAYVINLETKYAPRLTVHCLDTGTRHQYRMSDNVYKRNPFSKGAIIKIESTKEKNKMMKTDTGFAKVIGQFESWIEKFSIITEEVVL